jgi:hypothetical protein
VSLFRLDARAKVEARADAGRRPSNRGVVRAAIRSDAWLTGRLPHRAQLLRIPCLYQDELRDHRQGAGTS